MMVAYTNEILTDNHFTEKPLCHTLGIFADRSLEITVDVGQKGHPVTVEEDTVSGG